MATASAKSESKLKSTRLLLDSQLNKTESIIAHLVSKYDKKHPDVISFISDRLHNLKPFELKMKTEKADSLTEIKTMHQLREALQIAVELEMTVMFEYLFACFSVINNSDEVEKHDASSPYFSEIRREYKYQFVFICIQEMNHLRMANDMLISIGGVPDLQRVKFPSNYGEEDRRAELMRLNLQSLLLFAKNEEPDTEEDSESKQTPVDIVRFPNKDKLNKEEDFAFLSIAQLYNAISNGFQDIHDQIGDMMFTKKPNMKILKPEHPYTDLQTCLDDINTIQTQGEGARGGKLYNAAINKLIDWLKNVTIPVTLPKTVQKRGEELRTDLEDSANKLLKDIDNVPKLLEDTDKAINWLKEWEHLGLPDPPIGDKDFSILKEIEISHYGRFLVMIINYVTLMINEKAEEEEFCALFSRPSYPTPCKSGYKEATGKVIKIAKTSFHLLLKLLEGSMIEIPEELEKKYNITQRYNNIKFYPIMTVLIFPLGELLTYFQLSDKEVDKTAGFPFIPNENDHTLEDPLDKFQDIILTLKMLYEDSCQFFDEDFYNNLSSSVGRWLTDNTAVVTRASNLLKNIEKTIRVLYLGMTNGLLPAPPPPEKNNSKEPTVCKDKYYLNIEFNGRAIFKIASDPDPTFEPRGFSGNMFMYEFEQDPDHDASLYTQNENLYNDKRRIFKRKYIPEKYYDGVKITSVKLVYPCYYEGNDKKDEELKAIEKHLKTELEGCDFCFHPLKYNGTTYKPTFPQLNQAITRQYAIDPIFAGFKSKIFEVKRANLIRNPKTNLPDASIDFIQACLELSNNFAEYSDIIDDRLPKSGGYLSWKDTFRGESGWLSNTNTINANSGTGQMQSDFYTLLFNRCKEIHKHIVNIVTKLKYKEDPLVHMILDFLSLYSSKLIVLALMSGMEPEDRNELSYLCSRYLHLTKMLNSNKQKGYFKMMASQYFYQVPLNALAGDYLVAQNNSTNPKLKNVQFLTDQDWGLDFWFGGMDYDALTFFISGSMMIPVTIPTDYIQ